MPAKKVFVDTNIWLYSLIQTSEGDKWHEIAARFLDSLERPVISTQVIREATHNLIKKAKVPESKLRLLIGGWYQDCEINESDEAQFMLASSLRDSYSLSYWDSLIVAAALDAGCVTLYSEDMQHGQFISGVLRILNPFLASDE
jgi:predicted nucleic acid-binding protein